VAKFDKKEILKKAIRCIAKQKGIGKNSYHKVTNGQINEWLIDNGYSHRIGRGYVNSIRPKLPKTYREKEE